MSEYGLGRLYAPDQRDHNYPMRAVLPKKASTRTYRYWNQSTFLDQGNTPECVGYSAAHYLMDGPVTNRTNIDATLIYREAQKRDPWAHIPHEGSTVRAAAQYLREMGYISEYRWTWDLDTMVQAILEVGPVVVGTLWLWDMFEPDAKGFVKASGWEAGGHAYLANGVNTKERKIRFKNSWGREYGVNGNFWMTFEEFQKLLDRYAELMLAIENKVEPK